MWGCNENVSGGAGMTNAISVKDRLKKQAIEDGKTMQDKLVTFGLERTISIVARAYSPSNNAYRKIPPCTRSTKKKGRELLLLISIPGILSG